MNIVSTLSSHLMLLLYYYFRLAIISAVAANWLAVACAEEPTISSPPAVATPSRPPTSGMNRPQQPPRVPDPREFAVSLDQQGRVPPFHFVGQPWPDVLQWLATLS